MKMKVRDEDLRALYPKSLGRKPDEKISCPSEDAILRSFTTEISEEEKLRLIDHVADCAACRPKFQAAREILKGAKTLAAEFEGQSLSESEVTALRRHAQEKLHELEASPNSGKKRSPTKSLKSLFFRYRYASVAAGILMVFLAVLIVVQSTHKVSDTLIRGEAGSAVNLEAPRGIQEMRPSVFRWAPYPGAGEYEVRLMNEKLDVVWTSGKIKTSQVGFPDVLLVTLEKGAVYYWKVSVYLEDGSIVDSQLQQFILKK
jgi:hypothetical protein